MTDLILNTFDWVPEFPRGYVRDIRVRWALEEANLAYCVKSTPFAKRLDSHFAMQPFGQVPWLKDGDICLFESGAILLHIAEKSTQLMPTEPNRRSAVIQWIFAALNSVEMASLPWQIFVFGGLDKNSPGFVQVLQFLKARLGHMEQVLLERVWLTEAFSVADILMADVLRLVDRFDGLTEFPSCREYVKRATARTGFKKAYSDQIEHFSKGK